MEDVKIIFEEGACATDDYLPDPEWAYTSHKWYRIINIQYKIGLHSREFEDRIKKARYIHGDIAKRPLGIATATLNNGDMLVNWNLEEKFSKED